MLWSYLYEQEPNFLPFHTFTVLMFKSFFIKKILATATNLLNFTEAQLWYLVVRLNRKWVSSLYRKWASKLKPQPGQGLRSRYRPSFLPPSLNNGTAHFKKCKQLLEYQHLLLLRDIWWSKL
jgi:hypothetical protein